MFKPGINTWNGITVWAIDYRLESGANRHGMMSSICSVTAAVVLVTEDVIGQYKDYFDILEHPTHRAISEALKAGTEFITLALPEFETLTPEEQEAILHHEHHHIQRGDNWKTLAEGKRGIRDDLEAEKACDAYAVLQQGTNYIRSAVGKLLMRSVIMHSHLTGSSAQEVYDGIMAQDDFRLRF